MNTNVWNDLNTAVIEFGYMMDGTPDFDEAVRCWFDQCVSEGRFPASTILNIPDAEIEKAKADFNREFNS